MKQDQHCQGNKRIKSSSIQSRAIIGQNNSIVSGTNNAKNQQDHDRAQSTQSSAELEHVPRHRSSRSMHTQQTHHDSAPKLVTFPSFTYAYTTLPFDYTKQILRWVLPNLQALPSDSVFYSDRISFEINHNPHSKILFFFFPTFSTTYLKINR